MKKAFLVSHTHWDREWYLSFDRYRCLLVRTLDDILTTLERTDFQHFHLDGQTIILDDYLKVRPENRDKLCKFIGEGRLSVGPWYILQDEFLTSGEANLRNMLRGLRDGAKFGGVSSIGYLPDTFGHFSQMPQILRGFGIDNAIFCRGLTSSFDAYRSGARRSPSEVVWEGADGSRVLGVFGSDWYNNANEISSAAPENSIRRAVANLGSSNATENYLLYNGCDHQPIQKNLPELLTRAKEKLDGEIEIRHGSYDDYIAAVRASKPDLETVKGELIGGDADGQFAFIHTASIRAHLKVWNNFCQNLLERHAEPIGMIAANAGKFYDKATYDLAWEYLMQNHPHDSICACGIDDVYREMEVRFRACRDVTQFLIEDRTEYLAARIDCSDFLGADAALTVFNTEAYARDVDVIADIDLADGFDLAGKTLALYDGQLRIPVSVRGTERVFKFRNPDDSFRVGGYYMRAQVAFCAPDVPAFGYSTFSVRAECAIAAQTTQAKRFENDFIALEFHSDGSFDLTEKSANATYNRLHTFEDAGDAGDEYTYVSPKHDSRFTNAGLPADIRLLCDNETETIFEVVVALALPEGLEPVGGDGEVFVKYDGSVGQDAKKNSRRSDRKVSERITSTITLSRRGGTVRIKTKVENLAKNHRLRAVFPVGNGTECGAHTPFDIVKRRTDARPRWTLSDRADRAQAFVYTVQECGVFMLANRGSYEYEHTAEGTLKLTLLRCVDELGDWGYFPTPEAQMIGSYEFEYAIMLAAREEQESLVDRAIAYNAGDAQYVQHLTPCHGGDLPKAKSCLDVSAERAILSAYKRAEDDGSAILRFYNPYDSAGEIRLGQGITASVCNLNEEILTQATERIAVLPKNIVTLKIPGAGKE